MPGISVVLIRSVAVNSLVQEYPQPSAYSPRVSLHSCPSPGPSFALALLLSLTLFLQCDVRVQRDGV